MYKSTIIKVYSSSTSFCTWPLVYVCDPRYVVVYHHRMIVCTSPPGSCLYTPGMLPCTPIACSCAPHSWVYVHVPTDIWSCILRCMLVYSQVYVCVPNRFMLMYPHVMFVYPYLYVRVPPCLRPVYSQFMFMYPQAYVFATKYVCIPPGLSFCIPGLYLCTHLYICIVQVYICAIQVYAHIPKLYNC